MSRSFFRTVFSVAALFVLTSSVSAQTAVDSNFRRFSIGPYFTAGASVFVGEVPHTWKTDLKFAFSGGILSTFATSPKFGINLGLAYDARKIHFYKEDAAERNVTTSMDIATFDVYTGVKFNDFMIGFDFGFPMSSEMRLNDGVNGTATAGERDFSQDSLASLKVDICLGALFNIIEDETGKFQFMLKAAYPLTQMWDKTPYYMRRLHPNGTIEAEFTPVDGNERSFSNGVIPSLTFGFAYQFNLGGKY